MDYDWKPIETAPKDGTHLYLVDVDPFGRKQFVYEGWYKENMELFAFVEGIPLLVNDPKFWDYKTESEECKPNMNDGWIKGMETAPKNGSFFDVWTVSKQDDMETRIPDVQFRDGEFKFYCFSLDSWEGVTATHWRPRPEGPTTK